MRLLTSRLGIRLFLSLLAMTFGVSAALGIFFERIYRERVVTEIRAEISSTAALLASEFREGLFEGGGERIQSWIREIGRAGRYRITVLAPDGTVVGDSGEDPRKMESHRDRPEIVEAIERGSGESERFSETVGTEMLYFAEAIRVDGVLTGLVRVAVPRVRVTEGVIPARRALLWGLLGSLLLSFLLSAWIADSVADPLSEMERAVRAISRGDFQARVRNFSSQDLADLGSAINGMAADLGRSTTATREASEKLDLALSALNGGLVTVDSSDRLVFWNASALRLLDWSGSPTRGERIEGLIRVSSVLEIAREIHETGASVFRETTIYRSGAERTLAIHGIACSVEGGAGTMIVIQDVTDLKFLERARRDFVANASHELKTPLAVIKGYVDTLRGGVPDEGMKARFLEKLSANVDRLAALADDLLNLSRIESRADLSSPESVDGRDVVRGASERFRPLAEEKGVSLDVELGDERVHLRTNGESLNRILDNLLDNAIKYTRQGRITARVRREGTSALFEVEDTGIGISKADLERVFERFYRVDKARSMEAGGTGLGLSIVKHLATQIAATVEVESEIGRGSLFRIRLPLFIDS